MTAGALCYLKHFYRMKKTLLLLLALAAAAFTALLVMNTPWS